MALPVLLSSSLSSVAYRWPLRVSRVDDDMNDMGYGSHGILWYFMMFRYFDLETRPHEARMLHLSLSVLRMQMLPIDIDACTEEEAFQADPAKGWFNLQQNGQTIRSSMKFSQAIKVHMESKGQFFNYLRPAVDRLAGWCFP